MSDWVSDDSGTDDSKQDLQSDPLLCKRFFSSQSLMLIYAEIEKWPTAMLREYGPNFLKVNVLTI